MVFACSLFFMINVPQVVVFFFFQAEDGIRDYKVTWSSDVCSSDLTSVNIRRYLIRLDGISPRNKLLLLLTWHVGPEIRSTANRMEPAPQPDMAAVAALPPRSQADLLDAITHSIYHQPPTDWSQVTNLGMMRAVPEVKDTVNLAQQYVQCGYDPET